MIEKSTIDRLRQLALEYLDLATNGDKGRSESDPIYRIITEQRDWGKGYSSCGDLCHWLLYRLGCREQWINRTEHRGWMQGANISRLAWQCLQARPTVESEHFQPGDILITWNKIDGRDAHVMVVTAHHDRQVFSADYGQPGGKRRVRELGLGGLLGEKRVQRVIPLAELFAACSIRGTLVDPQEPNDWLQSLGPKGVQA